MADDRLELIASVKNLTSGPIADIRRSMRALAADAKIGHQLGITQAKSHSLALHDLRLNVGRVAESVKAGLAPALSSMGIASLSAAGGIAATVLALKGFAESARHLTFLSRQTQLSLDQLRVLEALAPRIGVGVEQMDSALVQFNTNMEKLRRAPLATLRETFEHLNVRPDPQVVSSWRNLISSLQGLPRSEQLSKVVEYLSKIRDISQKGVVLEAFGLPKAFANLNPKELQEQLDRIKQILTPMTGEEVAAGRAFANAMDDVALAFKNLRDAIGGGLAENVRGVADAISAFAAAHSKEIAADVKEIGATLIAVPWKDIGHDIDVTAHALSALIRTLSKWNAVESPGTALRHRIWGPDGVPPKGEAPSSTPISPERIMPPAHPGALFDREQFRGGALFGGPKPDIQPERIMPPAGAGPGGAKPDNRPLWKKLFDMSSNGAGGGIQPAGFQVPDDWRGALKTPGAGDTRGAVRIIEEGVLAGLRDFAAETKGAEGGGGGAGGAMSAIRANYSPGGGGGYSGGGGGTGEPAGGGGGAGTGTTSPMGELPGLAGGIPKGIESLKRTFHAPSIPAGAGGAIADHLKAAGVDLPPALEHKIRSGGQVSEGDLRALPPHILEKANRAITGAGRPPIYTDAKPPHFSVGAIRDSLRGTAAAPLEGGQIDRSRFAKELEEKPGLRDKVMRIAANEQGRHPQGTQSVMESMMNRAEVRGTDLEHQARWFRREKGGYYEMGNMGRGALENPGHRAVLERSLSNTLAGGNVSNYATDNSSGGLAARERASGKFKFQSAYHGETFFSPGWGEPGFQRNYAQWRSQLAERDKAVAARRMPNIGAAIGGTATDSASHGPHFGHRGRKPGFAGDLLGHAREAGIVGAPLNHKVTGNASVDIKLAGFPRGTTTKTSADGMFKTVRLNRGRAMPPANQEG